MDLDRNEDLRMIIDRVRARDGFAFAALVRRYARAVEGEVRVRLEGSGGMQVAVAEDEVRTALLHAPEVLDEFDFTGERSLVGRLAEAACAKLEVR